MYLELLHIIPALAGVIPIFNPDTKFFYYYPRTRGGDPLIVAEVFLVL